MTLRCGTFLSLPLNNIQDLRIGSPRMFRGKMRSRAYRCIWISAAATLFLLAPKSTVSLAPIVMRTYTEDWHAGIDIYKEWRKTWFVAPKLAGWSKDVHSWLQLQINGSEQDYTIPYRDILKYGEECAQNGVGAIQLVGWSLGGQDGGDPSLDTDPGLGTWQELHDSIAQIQAKGIR